MSASHSEPMGARNWEPDFGLQLKQVEVEDNQGNKSEATQSPLRKKAEQWRKEAQQLFDDADEACIRNCHNSELCYRERAQTLLRCARSIERLSQ